MRITESALRRIVRQEVLREAAVGALPRVGDRYEAYDPYQEYFVTDTARDTSGKSYYVRRTWVWGEPVEVIAVKPSKEFSANVRPIGGADMEDSYVAQGATVPSGLTNSYRVHFKPLGPPMRQTGDAFSRQRYPDQYPDPKPGSTFDYEASWFLKRFRPA
jgi:hypothetical protein